MLKVTELLQTSKTDQFWDIDSTKLSIRDLTILSSGLFSLDPPPAPLSRLIKLSITSGSRLVMERVDNKAFRDMKYVDLFEITVSTISMADPESFGFLLSRSRKSFAIYTRTKALFQTWTDLFQAFTVQTDFDRHFSVLDMYDKDCQALYVRCKRNKGDKTEAYLAKFVDISVAADEVQDLAYEIRLTRSVSSPLFAEITSFYEYQGFFVIVYHAKYETNLRELIQNQNLPESCVRDMVGQLAIALNDANRAGIILRQINLELLFVNESDKSLMICDLSAAVFKTDGDKPLVRACPGFIAPEVVEEKPYSHKADSFTAGVIGHILVTGKFPFRDSTTQKILKKSKEIIPQLPASYSQPLKECIKGLCELDYHQRLGTKELSEIPFIRDSVQEVTRRLAGQKTEPSKDTVQKLYFNLSHRDNNADSTSGAFTSRSKTTSKSSISSELTDPSLKIEVLRQELDRMQRKLSIADTFRPGMNVSNMMKRNFYRTSNEGSSKHIHSTLSDQETVFSLSIPAEEGIMSEDLARKLVIDNKFKTMNSQTKR